MTDLLATPNLGTGVLEDRDRVDFARLRTARRDRVFAAMEAEGVDALVLGREANVRYVSGARRLWTAGTRPFGPTCLVVLATRQVHLLSFSASYEGIPEELQPEDVYPLSWNPMNVLERFRTTPGVPEATRLGVDGLSPLFEALLPQAFTSATIVPAEPLLRAARRTKLPDELVCLRTAAAIAESALVAAASAMAPGATEKQLQGAYLARMCELGTSQFSQQGTFTPIGADGRLRWITGSGALDEGVPVAMAGGALWAGYEGSLARTWWCGRQVRPTAADREPRQRWDELFGRLLAQLRPGRTGADLAAAAGAEAQLPGAELAAYFVGIGHEGLVWAPHLDPAIARRQQLEPGTVVGVRAYVPGPRGGYLGEELVHVRDGEPELLTTLGHDLGDR
jgi:Xaa-Pro dipeptidase